jgi:Arc/MetJ-type ribon-helix-helix transcriptional regulator
VTLRLPAAMLAKIDASIERGETLTRSEEIRRRLRIAERAEQEEQP